MFDFKLSTAFSKGSPQIVTNHNLYEHCVNQKYVNNVSLKLMTNYGFFTAT